MACASRAYHSNCADLRINQPMRFCAKGAGAVNGARYEGYLKDGAPVTLAAEVSTKDATEVGGQAFTLDDAGQITLAVFE